MDKARINGLVKKYKQFRADSSKDDTKENSGVSGGFDFQMSAAPEKIMTAAGLAAGLAIIFDGSKKKRKSGKKGKPFYKRFTMFYSIIDSILDSTVASELKEKSMRTFKDDKLEKLEIENAVKFKL